MVIKGCVLLCVFVLASSLLSDALPATRNLHHRLAKRSIRLCGRMLVETLAAICQSEYYAPGNLKRNYVYESENFPNWDSLEGALDPNYALDFLNGKTMNQPRRRGIADECCLESCSIGQLFSYCGKNPGK